MLLTFKIAIDVLLVVLKEVHRLYDKYRLRIFNLKINLKEIVLYYKRIFIQQYNQMRKVINFKVGIQELHFNVKATITYQYILILIVQLFLHKK